MRLSKKPQQAGWEGNGVYKKTKVGKKELQLLAVLQVERGDLCAQAHHQQAAYQGLAAGRRVGLLAGAATGRWAELWEKIACA